MYEKVQHVGPCELVGTWNDKVQPRLSNIIDVKQRCYKLKVLRMVNEAPVSSELNKTTDQIRWHSDQKKCGDGC